MVTWEEPRYSDNVGVYYRKCNKENKDKTYPLGVHNITYTVVDYEYNFAVCDFQINVTKRGMQSQVHPRASSLSREPHLPKFFSGITL